MVTRCGPNLSNFPILFGNGGNALKATLNWAGITANTEFEVSLQYQAST